MKLSLSKYQIGTFWELVKRVISQEVPATPEDNAFLMSTLSDLAKKYDETEKDEEVEVDFHFNKWRAIWHCCNVCLSNKLLSSQKEYFATVELQRTLAESLDEFLLEGDDVEDSGTDKTE